ncbi:uncharacterized protein LOC101239084 [Hydra vulgaris]|uniref:Uncharacterized protein LOC101239084 n=1 Tax=Hydra vulgaris TaxID=6087 RepID=A0ABM4BDH5_HYDVU
MAAPKRCSPSLNQTVDSLQDRLKQGQNIANTLQERLKHGQNIADILENQISAAQKNLNFLQDQIHLANETVMSLKKHFYDAEEMLSNLVRSERLVNGHSHISSQLKISDVSDNMESSPCSPTSAETSPTRLSRPYDDKHEQKKSQYAQQLRQVLDVLQDESSSPQRPCNHTSNKTWRNGDHSCKKYLNCNRCHDDNEYFEGDINRNDDNKRIKSSEISFSRESKDHNRMRGSPHRFVYSRIHSNEIKEYSPNNKMLHTPSPSQQLYPDKFLYPHHIYSKADNDFHEDTLSRKKRSHGLGEEHLKYTKVKKIDGSKITAQKTLLDFNKRRFLPYNPRYDLDLLIVPPPLPATELLKGNSLCYKKETDNCQRFNSLESCKIYKKVNGEINKTNSVENKVLFTRYAESSSEIIPVKKELEEGSKTEEVKFKLKSIQPILPSYNLLEEENAPLVVGGSRTH